MKSNISSAAAILGRKGRAVNSLAQQDAARSNGVKGGRPVCLATIMLDTPRGGRGRILWLAATGQIRVARTRLNWEDAEIPEAPPCSTLDAAIQTVADLWGVGPTWDLQWVPKYDHAGR